MSKLIKDTFQLEMTALPQVSSPLDKQPIVTAQRELEEELSIKVSQEDMQKAFLFTTKAEVITNQGN